MTVTVTAGITFSSGGFTFASPSTGTQKAIFGDGFAPSGKTAITNLVSNTGVVSANTPGVGTARQGPAAAGYSLS